MSNMGIPIMPQDMMNKIALGTLRNELYMQNMEPIQTTVVPTVLDLLAANDASERLLNSPSQFSTPSEFSKFLEDIRARNEVARLERQGGSQNAGTPTGVGGGAGDLGGQAGDPVVRGSIESG